jgi:decaprenylphospho-beta-D-erythro-pentofuranosid-2-ulose 2-reductase
VKDALGTVQSVLVLGGASEIGVAIAAELAGPRHAAVVLAARRPDDLTVEVAALQAAGAGRVETLAFEADAAGGEGAVRLARTNYLGAVSVSLAVARQLRRQGHGTLVVLSSVAGERVRRANFIYGSTKAGLDGFAQGLADDLVGSGAGVLIVRPGFVKGRMTAGMDPAPMATTPDAVADAVAKALAGGREVIWVPGVLRPVFAVFRHLPRPVWRRLPV